MIFKIYFDNLKLKSIFPYSAISLHLYLTNNEIHEILIILIFLFFIVSCPHRFLSSVPGRQHGPQASGAVGRPEEGDADGTAAAVPRPRREVHRRTGATL